MPLIGIVACYLAGVLVLLSAGVIGWSRLTTSGERMSVEAERPKLVRRADRHALEDQPFESPRPNGAFRYGPEINHGRADTPVNHREQALQQARAGAAASAWARAPSRPYRAKAHQERAYRELRIDMGTRPSGH